MKKVTHEADRLFLGIGYFKRSRACCSPAEALLLERFLERSYEIESDRESFSPIRILRVRCLIHLVDELPASRYFSISRVYRRTCHTHTHTHTHTDIGTGVRTRRGSLERSRVVISARSVRTLSPYRINEWLDWSGTMNEHRRVLYKRARCGRLRRLLLSANKIPLRWLARVLIRLSLDAGFFLEIVVPIATFQTVDSTYRSR